MATAGRARLKLNPPNQQFAAYLRDAVKPRLKEAAGAVAANIPSNLRTDVNVKVNNRGRAVGFVTVMHPAAIAKQLKHGFLTTAAARAGLEVKRYRV